MGVGVRVGKMWLRDMVQIVEECVKQLPEATFIDGGGWTMDLFEY